MMKHKAISLIKEEHLSLAAVLDALSRLTKDVRDRGKPVDFRLMHAMLYYLREFPERRHHRSEDASLFALLLQRTNEADEIIRQLEGEHDQGESMLNKLTVALSTWEAGRSDGVEVFAAALRRFSEFYWRHMRAEEEEVLPIAQRVLNEKDWESVYKMFSAHRDPLLGKGKDDEFDALFSEIVQRAPAPIGLGEPR